MNKGNIDYKSYRLSSGGLIQALLQRMRIQQPGHYSLKRRHFALISISWLPLVLLSTLEGNLFNPDIDMPFLYDLSPYVRYLVVLPLLINVEVIIDSLIASMLLSLSTSGVIGKENENHYQEIVKHLTKRKDSYLADILIIVFSYATVLSFLYFLDELTVSTSFSNWMITKDADETTLTAAGWWLVLVSSPILQIMLYRWFWRFYLWGEFLFKLSRIKLNLQPTHPDMAGGLGVLSNSEGAFVMIAMAFGALVSVGLAEDILYTEETLRQTLPEITGFIITAIIIMALPMLFFSRNLIISRRRGRVVYGDLGYRLSKGFDSKWGDPYDQTSGEGLLNSADASAVCDYSDIYDVVNHMRPIPVSIKGFITQALLLVIPFVPLILTEYSLPYILKQIINTMV